MPPVGFEPTIPIKTHAFTGLKADNNGGGGAVVVRDDKQTNNIVT
jgi:hypothetical protein